MEDKKTLYNTTYSLKVNLGVYCALFALFFTSIIITSAREVMFWSPSVCLLRIKLKKKQMDHMKFDSLMGDNQRINGDVLVIHSFIQKKRHT